MQQENYRRVGWTGFAIEDGDTVGLDAMDGGEGNVCFSGMEFLFLTCSIVG